MTILFVALCVTYALVPAGRMPWRCVWPGALGATLAIGVLDYALPALPAERLDAARRHDVRVHR